MTGLSRFTRSAFERESKGWEPVDVVFPRDVITQRGFLVTGANAGLGYATSLRLAELGGSVVMVCRNRERGEAARDAIVEATKNDRVFLEVCDVSVRKDVAELVERLKEKQEQVPIHVLVNNAGELAVREDGKEREEGREKERKKERRREGEGEMITLFSIFQEFC